MPQLRQPATLADLALQMVAQLVRKTGEELIASVCSAAPLRHASTHNEHKIDCLFQLLQKDVPHMFADRVTSSALCAISEVVQTTECMSYLFTWKGDPQCRHVIERMIASAVHSEIRVLDLTRWPKFMWPTLCRNLHSMRSLQILKLHSVSACDVEMKTLVEQDICLLGKLVMFVYQGGCSDYMLAQLGRHCTDIQYLDVSLSSALTDTSISSLTKLQSLRRLDVSCTPLSENGCYEILAGLPHLESYACSKLSKPQLLASLCPNLSHVSLSYVTCDLAALAQLECLTELSLCRCNCQTTNLNGLLATKGSDLLCLNLKYVWNLDVVAVTSLCTRLHKLSWEVYTFSSDSALVTSDTTPHFHTLQHLDITNYCPLYANYQPLHYVNIRVMKMHFFNDISNDDVERAINSNYLRYLEELRLYHCGALSLNTVKLLLHHCDGLKVLGGVATWSMSARELEAYKTYVKSNNIDITIDRD